MVANVQTLAEKNLAVGTWTDQRGNKYVSLSRTKPYNKNIAIPIELVSIVIAEMRETANSLVE